MTYSEQEIGTRIFQLRNKLKLSQAAFGHPLGIQQSSISAMEKGLGYITAGNLASIAASYDVNLNWLYFGIGPMFLGDGLHLVSDGIVLGSTRQLTKTEAPGLRELFEDKELCHAVELTMDEMSALSKLADGQPTIFRTFSKTGFLELLIAIRKRKFEDSQTLLKNIRDSLPPSRSDN